MKNHHWVNLDGAPMRTNFRRPRHLLAPSLADFVTITIAAFAAGVILGVLKALIWG